MDRSIVSKKLELQIAFGLAGFVFIVYMVTLCPSLNFVDCGEMASVPYVLGIMHPTSYPLFTLVGYLYEHLPLGLRLIRQMNILAALESTIAVFFFFRFLLFFLNTAIIDRRAPASSPPAANDWAVTILPAVCGTLLLAFSEIYWSTALSIEVYPLHMIFLITTTWLFSQAVHITLQNSSRPKLRDERENIYWIGFAYLLGLSFTNHMTTILLAPAFLYLYFRSFGSSTASWKRILLMAPFFLIALSLYAYTVIRAQANPIFNWGNPINFERFSWVFTGKIYRRFMFYSGEASADQLSKFIRGLFPAFGFVAFIFVFAGIVKLLKEATTWFLFTLLLFVGCLFYSVNYEIPDIEPYFLLAHIVVAIWAAAGVLAAVQNEGFRARRSAGIAIIAAICLMPLVLNYQKVDESSNVCVEEYIHNMFKSLEPNAIILTHQYDWFNTPSQYLQFIEKERPDVIVLDKNLLQRPWYYHQLERQHGNQMVLPEREMALYAEEMQPVEHDLPYDTTAINRRILQLTYLLLRDNYLQHPLYVTQEIEEGYTRGFRRVPSGLAMRLYRDEDPHYIPMPEMTVTQPARKDHNTMRMLTAYAEAYGNNAIYAAYNGKKTDAMALIDKALAILPESEDAQMIKAQIIKGGSQ